MLYINVLDIVIIDDEPQDRKLIINFLRKKFPDAKFIEVTNREEMNKVLEKDFDVVIMDYKLKWGNGIEILKEIRSKRKDCGIIMFTSAGNEKIAVEAMKAGLDDYIIKAKEHLQDLIPAIHSALKNIEERRKREEAEKRFRKLAELTTEAIIIADENGKIIFWNKAVEKMFGYNGEEIKEKSILELIPSWDWQSIGKFTGIKEEVLIKNDGREFVAEVSYTNWNSNGKTFYGCIIRDVTEKKRAEEEIKKLSDLYYAIGMIINESEKIEELCSKLVYLISDAIEVDMVGIHIYNEANKCLQPVAHVGFSDELANIFMIERKIEEKGCELIRAFIEREEKRIDGEQWKIGEIFILPLVTKNEVHGVLQVAMKRDKIALIKENLLRSISEEIAAGIAKIKAHEKVKEALEKEREFKRRIAHYFFNPIAIAKGYLLMALEEYNKKYVKKALKAVERIERVIKNIVERGLIAE